MKRPYFLFLIACILLSLPVAAQKTITFESHKTKIHKKQKGYDGANSLTVGFASAINGYTPVYYERKVAGFLSIAVGGGFTYRSFLNDFGMLIWDDGANSEYFSSDLDVKDNYTSYKYRTSGIGAYASIAPKIYFSEVTMDGFYLSPMLEYKQFNFTNRIADVTAQSGSYYGQDDASVPRGPGNVSEYMHCTDITFNCGGHYQLKNHLAVGWSVGFGLRHTSSERLDIGARDVASSGNSYYVNHLRDYTANRPLFLFNFVMGGWF